MSHLQKHDDTWHVVVPSVNANRPAFEHLKGNGMWRVQLPREEHLFLREEDARKFAAENGVPT